MKLKKAVRKQKTVAPQVPAAAAAAVAAAGSARPDEVLHGAAAADLKRCGKRKQVRANGGLTRRRLDAGAIGGVASGASAIATATASSSTPRPLPSALAAQRWRQQGPVVIAPPAGVPCKAAVVWLHGPGGDPEQWAAALGDVWRGAGVASMYWKIVHLRAPRLRMLACGGEHFAAWGEILQQDRVQVGSPDHEHPDNLGHLAATVAEVRRCLEELEVCDGVPPARVVIGGFSQGAACALEAVLRHPRRVAGFVSLAGWLLPGARVAIENSPSRDVPGIVCHGLLDDKVEPRCSELIVEAFRQAGASVQLKTFRQLGHAASRLELEAVASFLKATLP